TKLVLICGAFAGISITGSFTTYAQSPTPAPASNPLITWTATGKQSGNVDVLFVQNTKDVTFKEGKLVLRGVNPVTVCFTDRPARLAGHMQTSKFVPFWSKGKESCVEANAKGKLSGVMGASI